MPPYLPRMPFPPWVPDKADQETHVSANVSNVIPRSDGWGPFRSFVQFTQALPKNCRGSFFARNQDGTVSLFAGTADARLYRLNNSTLTWSDVSQGGVAYAALSATGQWQFAQFNNLVIAVQANCNPQVFNLASPTTFVDLGGSPPQAASVSIVNRFVVLSGIPSAPYRVQWSDLDNVAVWTPGSGQADFQDLPDGGLTLGVAGFDLYAVIFQNSMARLMTYAPGSPVIFTITKITGGDGNGLYAPYGWVIDQDNVFWVSQEGFKQLAPGGVPTAIGKEMVDRYFFGNVDTANLQLVLATTDPMASRMYFAFKSTAGQAGLFDIMIIYDWHPQMQRWSRVFQTGEWIMVLSRPGGTLENMDLATPGAVAISGAANNGSGLIRLTVSSTAGLAAAQQQTVYGKWNVTQVSCNAALANALYNTKAWDALIGTMTGQGTWAITIIDGTHVDLVGSSYPGGGVYTSGGVLGGNVDLIPFSFDAVSTATIPSLGAWDANSTLGFFNGPPLEAIMETGEEGGNDQRMFVKGFRVITDAPSVYGNVSYRDNPQSAYNYTSEVGIDVTGTCVVAGGGIDSRYSRARVRIPAGTTWTYAMAVEPDGVPTGSY